MGSMHSELGQPGCPSFLIPPEVAFFLFPLSDNREPSGFGICSPRSLLSPGCLLGLQRAEQQATESSSPHNLFLRGIWSPPQSWRLKDFVRITMT